MPKFEDIYGKALSEMDVGEKEMAMFSYLEKIDNHLEVLNGKTKSIEAHRLYFKFIGAGFALVVAPIFVWWVIYLIGQ